MGYTVGNAPGALAPFFTLALFSLLTTTAGGGRSPLLVAQAFTPLALVGPVTEPLLMFSQALPGLTHAVACFDRLEVFLDMNPISAGPLPEPPGIDTESSSPTVTGPPLALRNAAISWTPGAAVVLRDLCLDVERVLIAITGPVGSGKSTLLSTIVGESVVQAAAGAPFHFFLGTDVALQFTTGLAWCLVQLIVLFVLGKPLSTVVPVLALVLFSIQRYYLRTSRQLRMLEIEAKTPLYAHFIATIRAFGWGPSFSATLATALDLSQRPFYMLFCVQHWLTLVLDLVASGLAVTLVALALSLSGGKRLGHESRSTRRRSRSHPPVQRTPGSNHPSLDQARNVHRCRGKGAAVRARHPGRARGGSASIRDLARTWYCGVSQPQRRTSAPVGSRVVGCGCVHRGGKIAVCGASGSGKASLVMALLKMMGVVLVDHVDIAGLDGFEMRSRLTIIPQSPFFMAGNFKFNLDPDSRQSHRSVVMAIEQVGPSLWEKLQRRGGLDAEFAMSEWSHGERQLLCLAGALLTQSRIVILDEAPSSVDAQTEAAIQEVVQTKFQNRTVISVIHRYTHIEWFDRVVVFEHGRIVECDGPRALLEREGSALRRLSLR